MRRKPYTELGVKRVKCFRCNNKADFQWTICADGNQYRPVCVHCDIALNKMVLKFMKFGNWEELYLKYKNQKLKDHGKHI